MRRGTGQPHRDRNRRRAQAGRPLTLDLIGHSTRDHHLPRLGGVEAVGLLACETAVTPAGQRTLRLLARTLRLPVYGTVRSLMKSHHDVQGFDPALERVLVTVGP